MQVLDNGYVNSIETWGSDERVIEAARMSTAKGFKDWDSDFKLLKYLYNHHHTTPFEMAGAIVEVKAPIFVFREWHRHRTQSYNEMSARYIPLPNENYIPTRERLLQSGGTNKQAQGLTTLGIPQADTFIQRLGKQYQAAEELYQEALINGVPKELARLIIPVGRYSAMRASANLLNWIRFLRLRMPSNAQWEIRQYADAVHKILSLSFPRTLSLFDEEQKTP